MTFWKWAAICIKRTLWDPAKIENEDHVLSLSYRQFSVFTVTPSKIELQTIQYRKSRIWKMKEDEYTKSLPRIRFVRYFISEIFGKRFSQICKALSRDVILVSLWGAQIWPPETNRNICLWVFLQMLEINTWRAHKDLLFNFYSEKRNVYWIF